jgi:hypothetical protein
VIHFSKYQPNLVAFGVIVVAAVVVVVVVVAGLVAFDYDCSNLQNDVIYSPLDPK